MIASEITSFAPGDRGKETHCESDSMAHIAFDYLSHRTIHSRFKLTSNSANRSGVPTSVHLPR